MIDVLVIGAGVAGLTAARALQKAGREVVVLEKSRGLGGRAATRTVRSSRVDHGAQFFTVRDARFEAQADAWQKAGHVAVWSEGFHTLSPGGLEAPSDGHPRYIFPTGMNTFGKLLGEGLTVKRQTRVTRILKNDAWRAETAGGETFSARRLIINTPPEQALELCRDVDLSEGTRKTLEAVAFTSCFTVIAGYPPERTPEWRGVTVEEDAVLSWVSHDSSKRAAPEETVVVLHSTPAFAHGHYNDDPKEIEKRMLHAARPLGDWIPEPLWTDGQRWRYSMVTEPYEKPFLEDSENKLLFCGDWCGGAKLEAAYLSGLAVAEAGLE